MNRRDSARTRKLQRALDEASTAFAQGRFRRAMYLAKSVCDEAPDHPAALAAWGQCALAAAEFAAARTAYAQALALAPGSVQLLGNLAIVEAHLGNAAAAITLLRRAVAIDPLRKELWLNLGNAISQQSEGADPAHDAFAHALSIDPDDVTTRMSYANALADAGESSAALVQLDEARRRRPEDPDVILATAAVLDSRLQTDAADHVLTQCAHPRVGQARLWRANYDETLSPADLLAMHRAWAEIAGAAGPARRIDRPTDLAARRPLVVALLSADFRDHPVTAFVRPLLAGANSAEIRIILYNDAPIASPDSDSLQALAGPRGWRNVFGATGEEIATSLREDRAEILVELGGHSLGSRMTDLAGRLAPWQGTWLGYPNTTGVPAIDFRMVDATTDPAPGADAAASERLVRIDGCFLCYGPPPQAPAPVARAVIGPPVFGSANNFHKAGPATIALWARLLAAVPGATLALKSARLFNDAAARDATVAKFRHHGISADRLVLHPRGASIGAHLAFYDGIDVALDPLNYNGTTTTCEALWMGVPVVTLPGDRHAARVGASLLAAAGMPELVAADEDGYVALAASLAADRTALAARRATQRDRLAQSALLDPRVFANAWTRALRMAVAGESRA